MRQILLGLVLVPVTFLFAIEKDKDVIPLKGSSEATRNAYPTAAESELLAPPKSKKKSQPNAEAEDLSSLRAGKKGESDSDEVAAPAPKPYIASLETFGTKKLDEASLRKFLGKELEVWFEKGLAADPNSKSLEEKLRDKIKAKFAFPFTEWSVIQYFDPGDFAIHVTLDVVESADVKTRMPFLAAPTGELADPSGLIKAWMEYEDLALDLVEQGQLEPGSTACPALHCPFGHKHPKLKKYEKQFVEGARRQEKELVEITLKDKRPEFRASAIYLLAYLKDGKKVVSYLVDRIKDSDDLVRNNSLRVLGDLAEFHPEYVIPLKPITDALNYPRVSDRSKAVYVLYQMASRSDQVRDETLRTAVPDLLRLLPSTQPDHRELSHMVLKKISGKDFAATDVSSWNNWYARIASDRQVTKKD